MYRTLKITLSILLFVLSILLAAVNLSTALTFTAIAVALIALHLLFHLDNGVPPIGYLEVLDSDFVASLKNIKTLFNAAERSIKVVSGQFSPAVYFEQGVFASLRDAIARSVKVEIILAEPNVSLENLAEHVNPEIWVEFRQWIQEQKVSIRQAQHHIRRHFILVDDTHLRIEDHRICTTYFDERAAVYTRHFEELAQRASPL